ncbi:uncharacterized protein LOC141714680 [Apium graveolens]|uniref:uncharacterized protein LOC141714680 n=1 Tax=Apium graveolens TaxID=4045 RepID=UPI003D798BC3
MEASQEDMKLLGVPGIYRESHKIMTPWRTIFNQLILAFILPLCFIILAQAGISKIQLSRIQGQKCGENYTYTSPDRVVHIRINLAYFAFPSIFSLLSTSAVVYTIACINANRDVSFTKVMSIMPQLCIRRGLVVTFVVRDVLIFIYIVVAVLTIAFCLNIGGIICIVLLLILLIGYIIGFVYIITELQLATVVTILEESHGLEAMKTSRKLTKGKFGVVLSIAFMLNVLVWTIQFVIYNFVLHEIALVKQPALPDY